MNRNEIVDLLSMCAAYDRRTAGEMDVQAWLAALGDLPYDDCRNAVVAHYQESTEWLMPAHLRRRVKAVRAERIKAADPPPQPPQDLDPDDTEAYIQWHKTTTKALADGEYVEPVSPKELLPRVLTKDELDAVFREIGMPELTSDERHAKAIERARREKREAEKPRIRERTPTDPIDRGVPRSQQTREQMQADIEAARAKQAKEDA